jgi:hypothetical protein
MFTRQVRRTFAFTMPLLPLAASTPANARALRIAPFKEGSGPVVF